MTAAAKSVSVQVAIVEPHGAKTNFKKHEKTLTEADLKFAAWYSKVNEICMYKIAEYEGVSVSELGFDIGDLPDELYRISFDEGVSSKVMASIVFKSYKKDIERYHISD